MSTRYGDETRERNGVGNGSARPQDDPAEQVAVVAHARRALLLNVHRHHLRREDLEDCYSQATLELLAHVRRGGSFANRRHLASALELRFQSRIRDRRRALAGRSPMQAALEAAASFGAPGESHVDVIDGNAEVERLVMLRHDLARLVVLARQLSGDQRMVLFSQLDEVDAGELCRRLGWSREKYRKVAQRGRLRLRKLMEEVGSGVPSHNAGSEKTPGTHL